MWVGDRSFDDLVEDGAITVSGIPWLARQLPRWIGTSTFGDIDAAEARPRPPVPAGTPLESPVPGS
jgi:hypothetical protein